MFFGPLIQISSLGIKADSTMKLRRAGLRVPWDACEVMDKPLNHPDEFEGTGCSRQKDWDNQMLLC